MKPIDYLNALIKRQEKDSAASVMVSELQLLKTFMEVEQAIEEGRAALAKAEQEVREGYLIRTGPMEWTVPKSTGRTSYQQVPKNGCADLTGIQQEVGKLIVPPRTTGLIDSGSES